MQNVLGKLYFYATLLVFLLVLVSGCSGKNGKNGRDGLNGVNCEVVQVSNGAMINCGSFSAVVLNGQDAVPTSHSIVELINPCGDDPNAMDEVIFRLYDGQLIAHYSHGALQFLTVLQPGNYQTTDGQKCKFSVSVTNQVSW